MRTVKSHKAEMNEIVSLTQEILFEAKNLETKMQSLQKKSERIPKHYLKENEQWRNFSNNLYNLSSSVKYHSEKVAEAAKVYQEHERHLEEMRAQYKANQELLNTAKEI